jgi:hypothetical protein
VKVTAAERSRDELRCPYCLDRLEVSHALACDRCGTRVHRACFADAEACPTLGCEGTRRLVVVSPDRSRRGQLLATLLLLASLGTMFAVATYTNPELPPGVAPAPWHEVPGWTKGLDLREIRRVARTLHLELRAGPGAGNSVVYSSQTIWSNPRPLSDLPSALQAIRPETVLVRHDQVVIYLGGGRSLVIYPEGSFPEVPGRAPLIRGVYASGS